MDWDDGEVEIRQSGDSSDEIRVVDDGSAVAFLLASRIPQRRDGIALEPD